MFGGRLSELDRLESKLLHTMAGNPANFMLTGDRGIGKSSLLNYVSWVAKGDITTLEDRKLRCLVIDIDIDENTSQLAFIKKIELGLQKELDQSEPVRKWLAATWDFLSRLEAKGVRINAPSRANDIDATIMDQFVFSLAETCNRLCSINDTTSVFTAPYDAVLLTIDEADNASKLLSLGTTIKVID
jgi:Cdc6-like AAA superfamily ATPase